MSQRATAAARAANTPARNIGALSGKHILLLQAAQEDETLVEGQSPALRQLLVSAGIPSILVTAPGTHGWPLVAGQLPRIERFLEAGWR